MPYWDNMTLPELEEALARRTGDHLRWENDVLEQYGVDATDEQKIDAAKKVLASMNRGVMGMGIEWRRRERLREALGLPE